LIRTKRRGCGLHVSKDKLTGIGRSSDNYNYADQPTTYLTFQNVITQLDSITPHILLLNEQVGRWADWWSQMKNGMETLKTILPKIDKDQRESLQMRVGTLGEGWQGVADQFALYAHKVG